jgi:hypothetical protein
LLPALGLCRLTCHPQERADGGVVLLRRLKVGVVTRCWDQNQPRAGDRRVQGAIALLYWLALLRAPWWIMTGRPVREAGYRQRSRWG